VKPGDIKTRIFNPNVKNAQLVKACRPRVHVIRTTVHCVLLGDIKTKRARQDVKIVQREGGQHTGLKNATRARKKKIKLANVSNANAGNKNLSTEDPLGLKEVGRAT
jgi:hypothetical protein